MKFPRFVTLLLIAFSLAGCAEYYQAEAAKAEATAAPYTAQVAVAQAERDVQLAQLDTQLQIVGIQATAQAEQVNMLVTQTGKSLSILEDAGQRQVELVEAQYATMQFNSIILVAAGVLVLAAVMLLAVVIVLRNRRPATVEIRREIVYLPEPKTPPASIVIHQSAGEDITDKLPVVMTRGDHWRSYCDRARTDRGQ